LFTGRLYRDVTQWAEYGIGPAGVAGTLPGMEEIGLFPLEMVLLPGEQVPLHIFEERYKELIGECLDQDLPFGLVLAEEGGIRTVGTKATVAEVLQRFPDGRMNILVEGGERLSIAGMTAGRSFQTARIEPFADEPGQEPDPEQARMCLETFNGLAEIAGTEAPELDVGDPILSFRIAGLVDFGAPDKQELLELRSEPARLERLLDLLDDAAETLRYRRMAEERARGNGQVTEP
jgi:ATP-dependent Lon protease